MTNDLKPMGTQSKETVDLAAAKAQDAASRKSTDQALDKAKDELQSVKEQVQTQAANVSDKVADYTQEDPLKAMLIAAAAGALVMGLLTLIVRSRD